MFGWCGCAHMPTAKPVLSAAAEVAVGGKCAEGVGARSALAGRKIPHCNFAVTDDGAARLGSRLCNCPHNCVSVSNAVHDLR